MALFQISNDKITIQVDSMGAELKSLKDVATGREYMWSGDPQYWKRTSPVLFPLVGSLKDGVYRLDGQEYPMGQHGFARDMEFQLKSQSAHEIWFTLESNEDTLRKYPYPFLLELGYELREKTVAVKWNVKNSGQKRMYFSIGGHPAFLCPIEEGTKQTDYRIRLDVPEKVAVSTLCGPLASGKSVELSLEKGEIPVTEHLFDKDALVIEHDQVHSVALVKPDGEAYLTVTFDAPLFGIWSPPKKQAPFICIEPWYGRCDRVDFAGDWMEREWGQRLEAEETFAVEYQIMIV